jgi:hypothetical protein
VKCLQKPKRSFRYIQDYQRYVLPGEICGFAFALTGAGRCPYLAEMYLLRAMGFLGVRDAGSSGGHLEGSAGEYFGIAHRILAAQ